MLPQSFQPMTVQLSMKAALPLAKNFAIASYRSCKYRTFSVLMHLQINTLRPIQNGHHFADDILRCLFLNENVWFSIKISPKFVPKGPINDIPELVRIMAWCQAIIWANDG